MWKWEAEGQAKAVVAIIHSAYEHHRRYAWMIEKLRSLNFHVVTGDLPGHGETSREKTYHNEEFTSYETYTKQLLQAAFSHNLPVFVFGHGLGGAIAIHVIQKEKFECAGVILSSPWFHLIHQPSKLSNALSSLGKLTSNMKIDHDLHIKILTRSYEVYQEEKNDPYYHSTVTVKWYKEMQQYLRTIAFQKATFPKIAALVMTASRDKVVDPLAAKEWLVNQNLNEFVYKEWPNCFHDLMQEPEREDIILYMESFMNNTLRSLGYVVS